jgi:putative endopeptidase
MNCSRLSPILLLAAAPAPSPGVAQVDASKPAPPQVVKSFDLSAIDKTADPRADFHQYACGNWIKSDPIPADQVRWVRSFSQVFERNRFLLWQELNAAKDPKTPLQKQYGDFFAACMDIGLVDQKGVTPIQPAWAMVASLSESRHLPPLLGKLENDGTPYGFFDAYVLQDEKDSTQQTAQLWQGGLSLPDRDYYTHCTVSSRFMSRQGSRRLKLRRPRRFSRRGLLGWNQNLGPRHPASAGT